MDASLVAVRLPPHAGFLAAVRKVWGAGDAVLPLPWRTPRAEIDRLIRQLRPGAVLRSLEDPEPQALADGLPVPAGTALVVATSGTSTQPRGVELTHQALSASLAASLDRLQAAEGERWLCCLPLHHVAGLTVLLRARRLGTEAIVHDRFDIEAIRREHADWISLVPTQLHRLLAAGVDLSSYRGVLLGGGTVPQPLLDAAAARGVHVVVSYGMTETCGGCVYDGIPLDGAAVRIRQEATAAVGPAGDGTPGRIQLRGSMLFQAYRRRPDLTTAALQDGWLVTSDLGRIDADGRLEVLGRADDLIVTGGENVAPSTVAEVLAEVPGVADVAVAGCPDEEWGEIVVAVVVPERADTPPGLSDLREGARERLTPAALPRGLVLVPALPRDELGKIPRRWLEQAARQAGL